MIKMAEMVENRLAGILAHWKWGLTNAFMEGLNSVFSAVKLNTLCRVVPLTMAGTGL